MGRRYGLCNATRDEHKTHVLERQNSVRTTSALDYWDQLVTLHYGGRAGICSHFREGTVAETGMAWAGGVFGVPAAVVLDNSILTATTSGRAFIYQNLAAANAYNKRASVALVTNTVGDFVGLRLDGGPIDNDNNYLEVVLYCSQASPTLWCIRTRRRTGGGAVSTQDSDDFHTDPGCVVAMEFSGSTWDAWNAYPVLHTNMGFFGVMYKPQTLLGGANLAFTPQRAGIVFQAGAIGETYMSAKADWFDIGRS